MSLIRPEWPAPEHVIAACTTRAGGRSLDEFKSNNLALHVGDDAAAVASNRAELDDSLPGEKTWQWLNQVHGVKAVEAACESVLEADACYTRDSLNVCTVMTADCLPILFCDSKGTTVAAAHAGWRGLSEGIIESTVKQMQVDAADLMVWMGPSIGPDAFEVGQDVKDVFEQGLCGAESMQAFNPISDEKYLADLYQLARIRLAALGVEAVYGGEYCTYADAERFYSYRRDGVTGRMASFIYLNR